MNILTDEQIREATRSINAGMVNNIMDGTVYDKVYPEDRAIAKAQHRETLKMVVAKLKKWQADGTHLVSNEAIEALNQSGEE